MKKLLVVSASPNGETSVSRQAAQSLVAQLKQKNPGLVVIERDLSKQHIPHVDGELVGSYYTPAEARNEQQLKKISFSEELVDELIGVDGIIVSTPMWNFSVPSVLKAYIDHLVRVGKTFSFAGGKLEGLVKNKKLYIVTSQGSVYSEGPMASYDHLNSYLQTVFGFIGLSDQTLIRAEGTNDPTKSAQALALARTQIAAI